MGSPERGAIIPLWARHSALFSERWRKSMSTPELFQQSLGQDMVWMLLKKLVEDVRRLVQLSLLRVDLGEIDVRLVKAGRDANASLERLHALIHALGVEVKHTQIVQGLG